MIRLSREYNCSLTCCLLLAPPSISQASIHAPCEILAIKVQSIYGDAIRFQLSDDHLYSYHCNTSLNMAAKAAEGMESMNRKTSDTRISVVPRA